MTSVRIYNGHQKGAGEKALSLRKKPIQSRSQMTLAALQDAFVQVLIDRGYEAMTIREVVAVAGIGIGTFYEYVPNMRSLAASTINQRCISAAQQLKISVESQQDLTLEKMVHALLHKLCELGFSKPKEWTAILLLERQVSSASALRKIHEEYALIWELALRKSSFIVPESDIKSVARMAHAISYGWYSHDLLFYLDQPRESRTIDEIGDAIVGFIKARLT
jgi:AcrR family transcriptional regulator